MPKLDQSPEQRPTIKPFNPLTLDRTVIAIPLLQQMEPELELISKVDRTILARFNTAIELNSEYKLGTADAFDDAQLLVHQAADKAISTFFVRQRAGSDEDKKRYEALLEATVWPAIEPPVGKRSYALGNLHAAVARRLAKLNRALQDKGLPSPIVRILPDRHDIIIDPNLEYPGGRNEAREWIRDQVEEAKKRAQINDAGQEVFWEKSQLSPQYVFARLEARAIKELVKLDLEHAKQIAQDTAAASARKSAPTPVEGSTASSGTSPNAPVESSAAHPGESSPAPAEAAAAFAGKSVQVNKFRAIYHIWPDFEVAACINKSIATVKADAAQYSFSARGRGITWALMDSGIAADHPHFAKYGNVDKTSSWHRDFTDGGGPFEDDYGHGTHVAGIIGGEWGGDRPPVAVSRSLKAGTDDIEYYETPLVATRGMAPECQLVSLKVLDDEGRGSVTNLLAAIAHIQEINANGRRLLIQGLNMSLGYSFDPEWFACGQSPLCIEVERLVKSGVVVVVAAGNTGYGTVKSLEGPAAAGLNLTINDPGNSDLAITVGATHRDMPHVYGVSYFSSKGPTGDGRLKPDLLAPGEKIISCATGNLINERAGGRACDYVENSGTSMAAPHVSGVIAAFLSVRREFLGQPEKVKEIFVSTATDLRRDRYFQGAGLIDLMRAIQSV
jgi:subtilisin family serine protease